MRQPSRESSRSGGRDSDDFVHYELAFFLIDSLPLYASRFAIIYRRGHLAEKSAFGYNGTNKHTLHHLHAHG